MAFNQRYFRRDKSKAVNVRTNRMWVYPVRKYSKKYIVYNPLEVQVLVGQMPTISFLTE